MYKFNRPASALLGAAAAFAARAVKTGAIRETMLGMRASLQLCQLFERYTADKSAYRLSSTTQQHIRTLEAPRLGKARAKAHAMVGAGRYQPLSGTA